MESSDDIKKDKVRGPAMQAQARQLWAAYQAGDIPLRKTQQQIAKLYGGIRPPPWHKGDK